MNIKELQPNKSGSIEKATITKKGDIRTFQKFGKEGKVCSCTINDESGSCTLSLWNEQVEMFQEGDQITIKDGWVKEWNNEIQISTGKNGIIEKI